MCLSKAGQDIHHTGWWWTPLMGSRVGEVGEDKSGKRRFFHFILHLYIPRTLYNGDWLHIFKTVINGQGPRRIICWNFLQFKLRLADLKAVGFANHHLLRWSPMTASTQGCYWGLVHHINQGENSFRVRVGTCFPSPKTLVSFFFFQNSENSVTEHDCFLFDHQETAHQIQHLNPVFYLRGRYSISGTD